MVDRPASRCQSPGIHGSWRALQHETSPRERRAEDLGIPACPAHRHHVRLGRFVAAVGCRAEAHPGEDSTISATTFGSSAGARASGSGVCRGAGPLGNRKYLPYREQGKRPRGTDNSIDLGDKRPCQEDLATENSTWATATEAKVLPRPSSTTSTRPAALLSVAADRRGSRYTSTSSRGREMRLECRW